MDALIYEFGDFVLDTRRVELQHAGTPRHLEPQVYGVLRHLVENRDRLVTRDELLDRIWGHRFVTPATVNSRIKALRQALDDDGGSQRVIRTVRGRGFRFVAPVRVVETAPPAARPDPPGGGSDTLPSPATQQIRFCRAPDGTRIAFATSGQGPPLVKPANWLTHLEQDWDSPVWRHWLSELGRTHTLIRYDERGCGLSDHAVAEITFEAWIEDLEAVVAARGDERVSLFGISQGCAVALAYAARHPDRVDRLVLYGGYVRGRNHREPTARESLEATMLRNLIRMGWGRDNPAFRQVFGNLFLPEGTPEQLRWFTDLTRTLPVENALRIEEMVHDIDVRKEAARVRAPTLVLHARHDAMIPFEAGCEMAALVPGARFVPLDSRNHVLMEHEPAWRSFAQHVQAFLAPGPGLPLP